MKKMIVCSFLILCIGIVGVFMMKKNTDEVENFALSEYQWTIEEFPYEKYVGTVDTPQKAKKQAGIVWVERFGKEADPFLNRKIEIFYDKKSECWLVKGTLPKDTLGGVPNAILRKDGTVSSVWHEQ